MSFQFVQNILLKINNNVNKRDIQLINENFTQVHNEGLGNWIKRKATSLGGKFSSAQAGRSQVYELAATLKDALKQIAGTTGQKLTNLTFSDLEKILNTKFGLDLQQIIPYISNNTIKTALSNPASKIGTVNLSNLTNEIVYAANKASLGGVNKPELPSLPKIPQQPKQVVGAPEQPTPASVPNKIERKLPPRNAKGQFAKPGPKRDKRGRFVKAESVKTTLTNILTILENITRR